MPAAPHPRAEGSSPSAASLQRASTDASADLTALLDETVRTVSGLIAARTVLIAVRSEQVWEVVAAVDRAGVGVTTGVRVEPGMALWSEVVERELGLLPRDVAGRITSELATVEVAPITVGDATVGALAALDREAVPVPASQAAVLRLVARFIAHAYDDVWRHREAEVRHDLDEKLASDRQELLSEVVHDFRTPLSVIAGMAEVIQHRKVNADQLEMATRAIAANARRLAALVDGLLEAETPHDLAANERPVQIDLRELVTDLAADTRQLLSRGEVSVTYYGGGTLRAPADIVRRLVLNLTANAVKYTRHGRISIGAEEVEGGAMFTVEDTGRGMTPEQVLRFTEAYTKGDGSDGFGLGLTIVRRLSGLLAATVEVDSELGRGTSFRVIVPNQVS